MTNQSPDLNKKVDEWLEGLGFHMGNPFASVEAEQERELLPRFFVDVPEIDEIRGEGGIIIFAPRGGGKTALRMMLADKTAPKEMSQPVLSVEFTDFDGLLAHHRQGTLNSESAIQALLEIGANTLLSYLLAKPGVSMPEPVKINLAQFLHARAPLLWSPDALLTRLSGMSPDISLAAMGVSWAEFRQRAGSKSLAPLVLQVTEQTQARLLAELNDFGLPDAVPLRPARQLELFVGLCRDAGLRSVFFLVDRVDEIPETMNDPQLQAELLHPILGHLPLLEKRGVAFKFFLPDMVRDVLEARDWLRLDRVRIKMAQLSWDRGRLVRLLNERMGVFSRQDVTDLGQICRSKGVAEEIEAGVCTAVSPRQLLLTMQQLCEAHVRRAGTSGFLTMADWKAVEGELGDVRRTAVIPAQPEPDAAEAIAPEGIPILRVQINKHLIWLGDKPIKLTPIQWKIVKALIENDGFCERDELAEKVWGSKDGVSEETIDRNIGRLRKKVGDSGQLQNYIETHRGSGFILKNYAA